jgi:hypothetical protein
MDKGTVHNTMTELNMSSDQFNLVTVAYYVRVDRYAQINRLLTETQDSIHRCRSTIESCPEIHEAVSMAGPCNGLSHLLPRHVQG